MTIKNKRITFASVLALQAAAFCFATSSFACSRVTMVQNITGANPDEAEYVVRGTGKHTVIDPTKMAARALRAEALGKLLPDYVKEKEQTTNTELVLDHMLANKGYTAKDIAAIEKAQKSLFSVFPLKDEEEVDHGAAVDEDDASDVEEEVDHGAAVDEDDASDVEEEVDQAPEANQEAEVDVEEAARIEQLLDSVKGKPFANRSRWLIENGLDHTDPANFQAYENRED